MNLSYENSCYLEMNPTLDMFNEFPFICWAAHSPWGSTSLASFSASEFARSVLAGVTAKIRQLSREMNCIIISRIWCSISMGWSPTGTLVIPGRSIRVRFNTVERKRRLTCRLSAHRYQHCRTIWHLSAKKTRCALWLVYLNNPNLCMEHKKHRTQNGFASFLYF